jgi:hypothetical protein
MGRTGVATRLRALALIAVVVWTTGGCKSRSGCRRDTPSDPWVGAAATPPPTLAPPPTLPLGPIERRAEIARIYRPTPDRRLLGALADVQRIVVAKEVVGEPSATFDGTSWTVAISGKEAARFSEFPKFGEALAATVALARKLESSRGWKLTGPPPAEPAPALPFDEAAFALATTAQGSWAKSPNRTALHDAARALVAIATQQSDSMELANGIHARALATLAIDKAYGGAPTATLEAMLAAAMGYRKEAQDIAASLPASDPVRQFVLREDAPLESEAKKAGAAPWTKYLYLRRLSGRGDHRAEAAWARAAFPDSSLSLPILGIRIGDRELANWRTMAAVFPPAVLLATARAGGAADAHPAVKADDDGVAVRAALKTERGATLVRFDRDLVAVGKSDGGPFVDAELHRTYLRAAMYTAFTHDALIELDAYGSVPRAKELLARLQPSSSKESKDFLAFYSAAIAFQEPTGSKDAGAQIASSWSFGLYPRMRFFNAVGHHAGSTDNALHFQPYIAARRLLPWIDTRPRSLVYLSGAAWKLYDIRLADKLAKAAIDADPVSQVETQLWWAKRAADLVTLRALAADAALSAATRVEAVSALAKLRAISAPEADSAFDDILAASNDQWTARRIVCDALQSDKRYERCRTIAGDWLSRHANDDGLEPVFARNEIASSFESEKRYADALAAITPAVASWQGGAMRIAARQHARLGHKSEAEQLAMRSLERYSSETDVGTMAFVRWMARDYKGAADFILHRAGTRNWRSLGFELASAFEGATADGAKAVSALLDAGGNRDDIASLYIGPYQRKDYPLAWEVTSRVVGPPQPLVGLVGNYTVLEAWKGEPAAAKWLRPQLREEDTEHFCELAMDIGTESVLWTVGVDVGTPSVRDNLWLARAATSQRKKSLRNKLPEARKHYEGPGGGTYWHQIGRYAVGLTDDKTVDAMARDGHTMCEVAFHMGARAQGEGRYEDAADYYRGALEDGPMNVHECRWALQTLESWEEKNVLLSRMSDAED